MAAKFVEGKTFNGTHYAGTIENRGISQRDKLETAILNLATALGYREVQRASSQSGLIYAYKGKSFQSASNTILSLSRELRDRA